jgi:hypothetical protein
VSPTPQLGCFIAQDRICGPDCMAFLPQAPTGPTYLGEQWPHCMVLVSLEKGARHLTIIAGEALKSAANAIRNAPAPKVG